VTSKLFHKVKMQMSASDSLTELIDETFYCILLDMQLGSVQAA